MAQSSNVIMGFKEHGLIPAMADPWKCLFWLTPNAITSMSANVDITKGLIKLYPVTLRGTYACIPLCYCSESCYSPHIGGRPEQGIRYWVCSGTVDL